MQITGPLYDQSQCCAPILRALPGWFGIEEATQAYIEGVATSPTWLACDDAGSVHGFMSLTLHNEYSAEIYVIGVMPDRHRAGIGRQLVVAGEAWLRAETECEFLQVKTLGPSRPDPGYERTRLFYLALGFRPLEELKDLWPGNPCLMMVKSLKA